MTLNPRSKLRNVRVELKSAVKITIVLLFYLPLVHLIFELRAFIIRFYIELRVESEILNVD